MEVTNILADPTSRRALWRHPVGRHIGLCFALVTLCVCLMDGAALAQENALKLHIAKTWGYAWGDEMQGLFALTASGPPDLERVTFLLDGQVLATVNAAPFTAQLNTDHHPQGEHTLSAIGHVGDGRTLRASDRRVSFVAAERGVHIALRISGPILALAIGFAVITAVLSVTDRRRHASPGNRPSCGRGEGAICPHCQRPFVLRLFGINVLTHRYERCPYCGKWSLVKPASSAALRAAEEAVFGSANDGADSTGSEDAEAALRRALDDSRYIDRLP